MSPPLSAVLTSLKKPLALPSIRVSGKLFEAGVTGEKWCLKGFTYGPFAPTDGVFFPSHRQILRDLAHIRSLGANSIRLYHVPPESLLDAAGEAGLRVMVDVPWDKHRCFLEDWSAQQYALGQVRSVATAAARHPAVFAISVANEIPRDVVRFSGPDRVAKFIDDLLDEAKQQSPDCLVTYTNYPSTEFLTPTKLDFYCANVYLDDDEILGRYLDRLHHVAGHLPLVLGELGFDSHRMGTQAQADSLARHVRRVYRHGLAGAFVFSYTDDWFTGGHQVEDWAFGVTDASRVEKPAAAAVQHVWETAPQVDEGRDLPRVSVVVCSYNGAATLAECLQSLERLNYPDYEVILVDDGSTDETPAIAAKFPAVRTIRQENKGLSEARNVGAVAATGQIVAYTDSDCMADSDWLLYLVQAMKEQGVDAIGGPNMPPPDDSWVAKCVAASPGGPSHVMLDDRNAEHVPGCNMAFWRDRLLAIGGFDARFRQAGDDVDICWRYLDAKMTIGYAASALVWHHRRSRAMDFYRQQKGYGIAEAMLQLKHPGRYNALGGLRWAGVIYGMGAVGLPTFQPAVYHGRFGDGPFQIIYRRNDYSRWAYCTLLEWHLVAILLAGVGLAFFGTEPGDVLLASAGAMWIGTSIAALRTTLAAPVPSDAPLWCWPLVLLFHAAQPVVRAWHRNLYRFRTKQLPEGDSSTQTDSAASIATETKPGRAFDFYFESRQGVGRETLLNALVSSAEKSGWAGNWQLEWAPHDLELAGTLWHDVRLKTATEELGNGRRFTRVRCILLPTWLARVTVMITLVLSAVAFNLHWIIGVVSATVLITSVSAKRLQSRRACRSAMGRLVHSAAVESGLSPANLVDLETKKMSGKQPQTAAFRPGFSLVELLVVIGIIGLLIGILLPALSRAREAGRQSVCLSNLRSLAQGMIAYANDHKGRLPNSNPPMTPRDYDSANFVLVALNERYIKNPAVFHCPSDRDPIQDSIVTADYDLPNSARNSFEFYSISWPPEEGPKIHRMGEAPLAWDLAGGNASPDPQQNHGTRGGNVIFGDTHGEWQVQSEWDGENWAHPADKYYPKLP